jgi:rhomboid protease GluP
MTAPLTLPQRILTSAHVTAAATHRSPTKSARLPIATFAIAIALLAIFIVELSCAVEPATGGDLSPLSLAGLGGLNRHLVLDLGEWWRLFTAPLLHMGLAHLGGNLIVLLVVGVFLEEIVGPQWFAALFFAGALGGSLGSLLWSSSHTVSIGASGAIMALMAAALACIIRRKCAHPTGWMLAILASTAFSDLTPMLVKAPHVDYNAHFGGFAVGVAFGIVLGRLYPDGAPAPRFSSSALIIALCGALASMFGFTAADLGYPKFVAQNQSFIPYSELPKSVAVMYARSAELVARYPKDPRAHYFRALSLLQVYDDLRAERELRAALSDPELLSYLPRPERFRIMVEGLLAAVLFDEHQVQAAQDMAKPVCLSNDDNPSVVEARNALKKIALCP